jgi:hypothetical protein
MAGNASSHRYGGMAVGRSRLGDLEGKRSAHTRQKTEIAETLACVGLPPIKHTVFSAIDLPCSMPLPGAGQRLTKSPVGSDVTRAPFRAPLFAIF